MYSSVLSTIAGVPGATLVPTPVLAASAYAGALPTLLILPAHELLQLLPSFKTLARAPVVLQVSTHHEHAHVLALRGSGLALLYSANDAEAAANALVAARVAASGRGVVHFGEFAVNAQLAPASAEYVQAGSIAAVPSSLAASFAAAYAALPAGHSAAPFTYIGSRSPSTLVIALGNTAFADALPASTALLSIALYRPLSPAHIRSLVPAGVKTVVVLEQVAASNTAWSPLFLDVVGAFAESDDETTPEVLSGVLGQVTDAAASVQTIEGTSLCPCGDRRLIVVRHSFRCRPQAQLYRRHRPCRALVHRQRRAPS